MKKPLEGILVLDISRVIAGPACCMHLADLGADVIRIESPEGDLVRKMFWISDQITEGILFTPFNKNKKSLPLDIFSDEGKNIFLQLVEKADVLVENYRSGVLKKAKLDYESLQKINPRLVYCSITGYCPDGPNKSRAGYDFAIQAETGLMSVNGHADSDPVKMSTAVIDLQASAYAAMCINAALLSRERDNKGRLIQITLYGTGISLLSEKACAYLLTGKIPKRIGNRGLIKEVVSDFFRTLDGGIILNIANQTHWEKFCEIAEFSHLKNDKRFNPIEQRQKNVEELIIEMGKTFAKKTTQDWVNMLAHEKGLVCSPVLNVAQALEDPEIEALRMIRQVEHPSYGAMKILGIPYEFPETPLEVHSAPPPLGYHTREILGSLLALDDEQIEELKTKSIIA